MGRCTVEKEPLAAGALAEKMPAVKKLEVCARGEGRQQRCQLWAERGGQRWAVMATWGAAAPAEGDRQAGPTRAGTGSAAAQGGEKALASAQVFLEVHLYRRRPALNE